MKKIILPLLASVFAVAGAFASIKLDVLPPEFIQLPDSDPDPDTEPKPECLQITAGCNGTGPTCVVLSTFHGGQYVVYSLRTHPTTCAQPQKHSRGVIPIP